MPNAERERKRAPISRRSFLGAAGTFAAGAALTGSGGKLLDDRQADATSSAASATIPFYGVHQGGIVTAPQRHSSFAAFDVTTERRSEVIDLLRTWTSVAANLCAGYPAGPLSDVTGRVEPDSGETLGLGPARLTVNFGFGPSLFGIGAPDRFDLREKWPMALVEVPSFPGDQLDAARSRGDLTVHACAEDPQVALHTIRQLVRAARGVAGLRWSQAGFNESAASDGKPRDLLGFKEGMINPSTEKELDDFVWVGAGQDQPWMQGGTYVVVRRIRILLDQWDEQSLGAQERVIGRSKSSGAPLGTRSPNASLDLDTRTDSGQPAIAADAHVRLASAHENWGQMLLRRSYAFDDGAVAEASVSASADSSLDAGLFFVAYQQNPRLGFIPIYARLAAHDALRHFTIHTGSAVAAIPPGIFGAGHFVGEGLFE